MQDDLVVGVDIGGTKVAAGLVDCSGKIHAQSRTPMVASDAARGLAAVGGASTSFFAFGEVSSRIRHRYLRAGATQSDYRHGYQSAESPRLAQLPAG